MRLFFCIVLAVSVSGAIACSGAASSDAASDDEAIRTAKCVDILTLTCKSGFAPSEVGCAQSHVAGAHPLGKCAAVPPPDDADGGGSTDDVCTDSTTLKCKSGFEQTEVGCLQSHVAGAHPFAKCVAIPEDAGPDAPEVACTDILTLTCSAGFEPSEDSCAQSHVVGAHPQGRCVPSSP